MWERGGMTRGNKRTPFRFFSSPSSTSPFPFFGDFGTLAPVSTTSSSDGFCGPRRNRYTRNTATMITNTKPNPAPAPPRIAYTRSIRDGPAVDVAGAEPGEGLGVGEDDISCRAPLASLSQDAPLERSNLTSPS
jgi:hypothetical protein